MTCFDTEIEEHLQVVQSTRALGPVVLNAAQLVATTLHCEGKLLLCGNGGSAADCQHIAAEFVGRFVNDRPALAAIALTVDSSTLTCVANDYGSDHVFSRQVEALGNPSDTLIVISTSGNSPSIINALIAAKAKGVRTIALLGRDGGKAQGMSECEIVIPSMITARIQEMHIFVGHFICGEVERILWRRASV